jgi:hypothetical protein
MSNAVFGFGSWCRRGAATLIENKPKPSPRVVLNNELRFQQTDPQTGPLTASETLELYGPGEITGFDGRTVTRTWPGRNVMDAEQYSFAHIEFDQADLPWRYTPFSSGADDPKSRQHVLSFEVFNGQHLSPQQQFSNDGAFWVWSRKEPPLASRDTGGGPIYARIDLASGGFGAPGILMLGSVDFTEPAASVALAVHRFVIDINPKIEPTIVFEGFHGPDLVVSVEKTLRQLLIGSAALNVITAPAATPMTRFVMRVGVPPPLVSPTVAHVYFDITEITYTTTAPVATLDDGPDRLRPWFVLIVLRPEEIIDYWPAGSHPARGAVAADPFPLSAVRTLASALPDLSQSWAWAHVQVSGKPAITQAEALAIFETAPHTMISRIICPRQLDPGVAWRAFLVPSFERGRLAGLGLPPAFLSGSNRGTVGAEVPAWGTGNTNPGAVSGVLLPIYYEWSFGTAASVDFESLVRLLEAKPLPADVGVRPVDAYSPDPALPPASVEPLWIEGALKPAAPAPPWQVGQRAVFVPKFTDALNAPKALLEGDGPPVAAPPLVGRWLGARDHLNPAGNDWFDALNADPRYRVAAGAAGQIVQEQEDKMLAGAWQQIDGLPEINEKLRFAQFARTIARRVRDRRLKGASLEAFLYLTAPLFRRVRLGSQTIAQLVANSPIGRGPFEATFRRLLRRLRRRLQLTGTPTLLDRMNRGVIAAAPLPVRPKVVLMSNVDFASIVEGAHPRPDFTLVREVGPGFPPPTLPVPVTGSNDSSDAALFRAAAKTMLDNLHAPRFPRLDPVPLVLADVRTLLTDAADPANAMVESLQSRLHLAPGFVRAATDPLEPILASPEFDNAMYEPLRQLSEEWILPGVSKFPTNAISLAEVNQAFIEAYLLGLSHELGRSLLFHDFPTDQRGTHFRQFWESGGYIGPRTREELRDIRPIDEWLATNALGANGSRPPLPNGGQPLVLLIRGDVLRQYPTAVVYAAHAKRAGTIFQPEDPPVELQPIFRGRLGGDIAFFGFELTADEARSSATDDGWFFILQEQPNEPRFGLEPGTVPASTLTKWSDLRLAHFGSTQVPGYVDLNATVPDTHLVVQQPGDPAVVWHANGPTTDKTGTTSAQLAWITLRRWLRIAIHADRMLQPL